MPDLTQQDQSRLHSMNATTFVSLTSLLPGLPRSPKNQKSKQFDGYFLDEVITFRKKCIENDQSRHQQVPCKDQKQKQDKPKIANDIKITEQRAKTELFEYSEQVIRKQFESLQVQATDAERLPNLSTQLSAFKQQQDSFLKELLSKKCKEKLLRCNYPSNKSISTQISCQKIWLKHKRSLIVNSKSTTEDFSNLPACQSLAISYSQTEQLINVVNMPQERLKLYRKAIVMSLNHQNQVYSSQQRLQRIHLSKFKKERYRKQLKFATASHQELNRHPISLILHCKTRQNQDFINQIRQRRTNSQNGTSSIKSLVKDKVARIRSTNSEYLQQEKRKLLEGLNILNVTNKQSSKKLKRIPQKSHLQPPVQGLQSKTKKKMMSIFRKIKEQRVHSKSSICSPDSLSSSMKINSKENLKLGCFNLNGESTKSAQAKSNVLKTVKQDVKINRINIINSLKLFAESKKSRHVQDLFSNKRNKSNSNSGVLLRDKQSLNQ